MSEYKDTRLRNLSALIKYIRGEDELQIRKWGIQERTLPEWLMYATEELGELSEAISEFVYRDGDKADIINEAIQTATLVLKIADMVYLNPKEVE